MAREQEVYLPDDLGEEKKPGKGKRILKIFLLLLLIIVLVIGGFLLGVYLKIFDTQEMNEKLALYNVSVIGQFFVKPGPPATQEEPDREIEELEEPEPEPDDQKKKVVLTKKDIERQRKEQEAAERKRVSKLARLYNEMKPKDAAAVMDDLDDDMAISILQRMDESQASAVLSQFEPSKAARLTRIMYSGAPRRVTDNQ